MLPAIPAYLILGLIGAVRSSGDFLKIDFFIGKKAEEHHYHTHYTYTGCTGTFNAGQPTEASMHRDTHQCTTGLNATYLLIGIGGSSIALWYADKYAKKFLQDSMQLHRKDASILVNLNTMYDQLLPYKNKPEQQSTQICTIKHEIAQQQKICTYIYMLGSIFKTMPLERMQKEGIALRQQAKAAQQRLVLIGQKIDELIKQEHQYS